MTQLKYLVIHDLSLHVMNTLSDRTKPLAYLEVQFPGVNWVSVSVCCQCAHNTILSVAVCSVWYVSQWSFCWTSLRMPVSVLCRTHTHGKPVPVVVHCNYACSQSTPVFVKHRISTRMVRIIRYVRDRRATFAFRVFVWAVCCLLVRVFIQHGLCLQCLKMVYSDYVKQRVLFYYCYNKNCAEIARYLAEEGYLVNTI